MSERFRLWLAQLNPTVGDLTANADAARAAWAGARGGRGHDRLSRDVPDGLPASGPCEKARLRHGRAPRDGRAGGGLRGRSRPSASEGRCRGGSKPFNAYYILQDGEISATVLKHHLPNYNVFDEKRYYHAGDPAGPVRVGPLRIGVPICEDAWFDDVTETLAETGAEILLVPNGSPYHRGKMDVRQAQMVARVIETGLPLVYLNLLGGQDDQVFDGASFVLNPHGSSPTRCPPSRRGSSRSSSRRRRRLARAGGRKGPNCPTLGGGLPHHGPVAGRLHAQGGFSKALLGLSGGVDSALVATIACDALAPRTCAA
jgi:NAD+ synthase